MSLARDLVELEARLRSRSGIDLFSPIERGGLVDTPECTSLLGRVERVASGGPTAALRLCLQALRIQFDEMSPKLLDAEFVATLPPDSPGIARPTERVMREMISGAAHEIVMLGYEFTEVTLIDELANRSARGVHVIMICDRGRGSTARVLGAWPGGVSPPRIFQDRERTDGAPHASMHAKCLLVDGCDLLITSANFTFHGLHGNIEMGVRLSGAPAAEARKIFSHLVESRIVEECE